MKRLLSFIAAVALLQACAGAPRQPDPAADAFAPVLPEAALGQVASGTVYNPAASFDLFMDLRARQVGDILTVMLVERTNASKESSTSTDKGTSIDTGTPIFMGKPITNNGNPLTNQFDSKNSFDGKADSSQSNRLDGSITVTVAQRLPNGNLLVRGEKQITINQGQEYVRLQGIVRPVDIGPQNSVPSTKVGDARITYSGKGALADANHPGWLARFFNSPWFPF
ncbi:MAG TPA: flagellar basal body L-ring protein FlgH [Gammaproteobacteria bacterium]|nr:flagellar basal body L-ring protein FlgH [Gammaproteobacteria bacterium]